MIQEQKQKNDKMLYLQLLGPLPEIDDLSRVPPFLIAGHKWNLNINFVGSQLVMKPFKNKHHYVQIQFTEYIYIILFTYIS